jgi:hypothetical protein
MPKRVRIVCTGNSARSQMAEGPWRHDGGGQFEVFSAGVTPSMVLAGGNCRGNCSDARDWNRYCWAAIEIDR